MYNKIIFYNQFGNGDIFESREFVKAWMKLVPANEYYYAHCKNPRILLDIPELKFTEITPQMNPKFQIFSIENTLFVNTWIGITGKYVLPGIGCTVEKLYEMHNEMLGSHGFNKLPGTPIDYIPEIDYSYYDLGGCHEFLNIFSNEKIFIDNGLCRSLQAKNFEFIDIIESVARNHANKTFLTSQAFVTCCQNIFNTGSITQVKDLDLPEISYLSTFCSTLIGRNSGPHVHTQVRRNMMDENKKLLSFTYHHLGSSFVVNTDVKIQKHWSNVSTKEDVINVIEGVIND